MKNTLPAVLVLKVQKKRGRLQCVCSMFIPLLCVHKFIIFFFRREKTKKKNVFRTECGECVHRVGGPSHFDSHWVSEEATPRSHYGCLWEEQRQENQNRRTWSADCSVEDLPDSGTVAPLVPLSLKKRSLHPSFFILRLCNFIFQHF